MRKWPSRPAAVPTSDGTSVVGSKVFQSITINLVIHAFGNPSSAKKRRSHNIWSARRDSHAGSTYGPECSMRISSVTRPGYNFSTRYQMPTASRICERAPTKFRHFFEHLGNRQIMGCCGRWRDSCAKHIISISAFDVRKCNSHGRRVEGMMAMHCYAFCHEDEGYS